MPLLFAIPFALALAVLAAALSESLQAPALPALMVIGTAIWAHFDAKKHELGKYRSGLINPEVVAIGCILLWIAAFPWYLSTRHKIRNGRMPLKNPQDGEGPRPLP
jgi:hypothetical protein